MEPKKHSRLPQNPRTPSPEPLEDPKVVGEEEEEWEEVEEERAEGEDSEDEEVDESEEETEVEEGEDDMRKNSPFQPSQVRKNRIIRKQSNLLQSDAKRKEEKERGKSYSPPSPSPSNFTIRHITHKRPTPEYSGDDEKDSRGRKKKTKTNEQQEKEPKSLSPCSGPVAVGRVWCQEDEIAVLEGMLEYRNKEGTYPPSDMFSFHEFIRNKLYGDISRMQLYDKIRRLRKKFFLTLEKTDKSINPTLPKPHDYVIFGLSTKIWSRSNMVNPNGNDAKAKLRKPSNKDSVVKKDVLKRKAGVMDDSKDEDENLQLKYPYLSESLWRESSSLGYADSAKSLVKDNLRLIGQEKAEDLDNEWKKLREQESEILLKKMYLISEQTKLILDAKKYM